MQQHARGVSNGERRFSPSTGLPLLALAVLYQHGPFRMISCPTGMPSVTPMDVCFALRIAPHRWPRRSTIASCRQIARSRPHAPAKPNLSAIPAPFTARGGMPIPKRLRAAASFAAPTGDQRAESFSLPDMHSNPRPPTLRASSMASSCRRSPVNAQIGDSRYPTHLTDME